MRPLMTATATSWDGRIQPLENLTPVKLRDTAEQLAQWLAHHASEQGIAPVLAAFDGAPVRSPLHRRLCDALTPMLVSRNISSDSVSTMAAQIIGLGDGLTPSGDDLLVGFFAVLHLTGQAPRLRPDPAGLNRFMVNTTDLSAAFLRCALQGHFSEPMVRLAHALYGAESGDWQAPAANLARVGHSSGVDAMVGMAFGNLLLASAGNT